MTDNIDNGIDCGMCHNSKMAEEASRSNAKYHRELMEQNDMDFVKTVLIVLLLTVALGLLNSYLS